MYLRYIVYKVIKFCNCVDTDVTIRVATSIVDTYTYLLIKFKIENIQFSAEPLEADLYNYYKIQG